MYGFLCMLSKCSAKTVYIWGFQWEYPLTYYTMNYTISLMNHNRSKNPPRIMNFSIDSIFFVVERTKRHRNYSLYLSALRLLLDAWLFKKGGGIRNEESSQSLNIMWKNREFLSGRHFFLFFPNILALCNSEIYFYNTLLKCFLDLLATNLILNEIVTCV